MYLKCLRVPSLLIILNLWWWCINGEKNGDLGAYSKSKLISSSASDSQQRFQRYPRTTTTEDGTVKRVERLQCYICSWSKMGPGNSSEYDICSSGHFERDQTSVIPCEHGCQSVSFRNSEKEEIRHFYRNCWKAEAGKELKDKCYKQKTVYGLEERCECLSNLCNSSPSMKFLTNNNVIPLITFLVGISSINSDLVGWWN